MGDYLAAALAADIDSLVLFAGIHPMEFGFHRALSKRFPFGVYYRMEHAVIRIHAVLDLRRNPAWIRHRLTTGDGRRDHASACVPVTVYAFQQSHSVSHPRPAGGE
ncbi:MAG: hypothetical protein LV480_05460 [Methylacidiphilales bacterium]|nr:hypothetical protein [Candidatus Methylacidiphilales bacterium]